MNNSGKKSLSHFKASTTYAAFVLALLTFCFLSSEMKGKCYIISKVFIEQTANVKGHVKNDKGESLPDVSIIINGITSAITDSTGEYSVDIPEGATALVFSCKGFKSKDVEINEQSVIDVVLIQGRTLDRTIAIGLRGLSSTIFESPVPVESIYASTLSQSGENYLDMQLSQKSVSYNSTDQPVSDAEAYYNPSDLRGLLPSRTLVLVNGKRKNASALVYNYVTVGRGEVGVDMKSIPTAAIDHLEILKGGATAQYGSDAIAGVINIVLKKKSDPFIGINYGITSEGDGQRYQIESGFGINIFNKGFADFTFTYTDQSKSDRAGLLDVNREVGVFGQLWTDWYYEPGTTTPKPESVDWVNRNPTAGFNVGLPETSTSNFTLNSGYTLDSNTHTELYAFGTLMNRSGNASQFARTPWWVPNFTDIYPGQDFFLAEMSPSILDYTGTIGIRTIRNFWNIDLSATTGKNKIDYYITNSFNPSLGTASPSDFYNGTHEFSQIVENLDVARTFKCDHIKAVTLAFGAELRTEKFITHAGEEASWINGGSASFSGFSPANEAINSRHNFGAYTELNADITKDLLLGGAVRYEKYSDFGDDVSWKLNGRYKFLKDKVSIRAYYSNGYRAPSLGQVYFSSITTTLTPNGIGQNGILENNNTALRELGIPHLKAESAQDVGGGFSMQLTNKISLSLDVYQVNLQDRIVLSGQVTATGDSTSPVDQLLASINSSSVGFFMNAVDSKTQGAELTLNFENINLGKGQLHASVAAGFNKTTVEEIHLPQFIVDNNIEDKIFSREDISRVETWRPKQKFIASITYSIKKISITLNGRYYGKVVYKHPTNVEDDRTYSGKLLADLAFNFLIKKHLNITLGADNLLNVYPDELDTTTDANVDFAGRFKYPWQTTQFGIDGMRVYTKLLYSF